MTPHGYVLEQNYTTRNSLWPGREQRMTGIVIHSIGVPQERADVLVNNFNRPPNGASVHCFIEPGRVVETFPTRLRKKYAARCGHVGSGRLGSWNNSRLGIEMCEPRTIRYTGGARFEDLNREHTRDYAVRVTDTTARYCADLCVFHGIDVSMIDGHLNASRLGWGSASGDPDHIWNHIGYTMEQFRRDVQKYIDEIRAAIPPTPPQNNQEGDFLADMTEQRFNEILDAGFNRLRDDMRTIMREEIERNNPTFKFLEDIPEWGRSAIKTAIDKGYMSGTGVDGNGRRILNVSWEFVRMMTLMHRTGSFERKCPDGGSVPSCFCPPDAE